MFSNHFFFVHYLTLYFLTMREKEREREREEKEELHISMNSHHQKKAPSMKDMWISNLPSFCFQSVLCYSFTQTILLTNLMGATLTLPFNS